MFLSQGSYRQSSTDWMMDWMTHTDTYTHTDTHLSPIALVIFITEYYRGVVDCVHSLINKQYQLYKTSVLPNKMNEYHKPSIDFVLFETRQMETYNPSGRSVMFESGTLRTLKELNCLNCELLVTTAAKWVHWEAN